MTRGSKFAALALAFLLLLALATSTAFAAARPVQAVQGHLELASAPSQPLPLNGEWGFAWQRFVDPGWERQPASAFAPVPASWNDLHADGKPDGENGWGSYLLQVGCPRGQSLALEAFGQRTSSALFVNGTLVAQHGTPGTTAQGSPAAIHNRVPITREFACPLRITLHVSNYEHRAGGFVRPMLLGTADTLARGRESRVIRHAALAATYLLTSLVALIFFAVRRRERTPLAYGLFCVAMLVYTDMIGERLLLRSLPPQLSWHTYMRVEYLAWLAAMALFLLTLRGLFPAEIHRRVAHGVLAFLGAAAVAVLVLPPGVYSYLAVPGQAAAVGVAVYIAAAMVRAQARSGFDARVLLAGMAAVLVALLVDLLLLDAPGPDRKFAPLGFALFLLSPAVVIARRLSAALNAEERSHTLEENARLREDVERMSRHDLKTPLNSVLGAARLLRDSGTLAPEQRELVDVLQRAGLRMLEMVNLSLGLYRMEKGSYVFRPQAVDLQEVVTRVLVDLHPLAHASGVVLHRRGSDRTPVRVRGEELLCYSIVANLVKNAIEATRKGQRVTLELARADPVALAIHNPGAVPPEIAARFFEKYVTGGKTGGTGLGTYSARLMARAQQGELAMRTGDAGTTLTFTLRPLKEEALVLPGPESPQDTVATELVRTMPARTVLVVDDDEFTRLVTRRFLPSPPFQVETAANGEAAARLMERRWPDFLLVDMEMPVRDGVATVRWVREQEDQAGRPRCKIVMLSGNDDEESSARAMAAGADRFLVKPVVRETLLGTLLKLERDEASAFVPLEELRSEGTRMVPATAADEVVRVEGEWLSHVPEFIRLQRANVEGMAQALQAGQREDVRFLAHRAFGGLATFGLAWAARQSRFIEEQALDAPTAELDQRIMALKEHLARVRFEAA